MGNAVGVHSEADLAGLTPAQREQVKQEVLRQLQNNGQIRDIINNDPTMLTRTPAINAILKQALAPVIQGLKNQ